MGHPPGSSTGCPRSSSLLGISLSGAPFSSEASCGSQQFVAFERGGGVFVSRTDSCSVVPTWKGTKMALLQSTVVMRPVEIWHACTTERNATARETLRVGFVPSFERLLLFRFRCRNRSRPPKRAKNSVPSEIVRIRAPVQCFMRVPLFPKAVDPHRS